MKLLQSIKMAWSAIVGSKMRSFLTMLGIIIGVLSVTLLVSIVQGTSDEITGQVSSLGTNLLLSNFTTPKNYNISREDVKELIDGEIISGASPTVSDTLNVSNEGKSESYSVNGGENSYIDIRNLTIEYGRNFTDFEVENMSNIAVIGSTVAEEMFGTTDNVIGEDIKISGRRFTICGIMEESGTSLVGSTDEMVIIPLTTAQRFFKQMRISQIYFSAASEEVVTQAESTIEEFLMSKTGNEDDYMLINQSSLLDMVNDIMGTMTLLLASIAGISLLVGGIGIMNIMLVSVSERTREIGVRKAIGAQKGDIILQFLMESIVISITGGIIGLILGGAGVTLVGSLMDVEGMTLTVNVAALAVLFSVAIGMIFGLFPANKAANLKPIDALRYE